MNKTLNDKEFKKLHEVELEILKEVDYFCQKNKITYFLIGGSMLGAVRHQGFIPWDDDIDVGMPRKDYEKFIHSFPSDKNNKYFVETMESNHQFWYSYAKVKKKNTKMVEAKFKDFNDGKEIFIDIFPFDNVPNEGYQKIKVRSFLIKAIRETIYLKRKIIKVKDLRVKVASLLLVPFSVKFLYKFQHKLMTKYENINTDYLVCFIGEYKTSSEYMKKEVFLPVKKGIFEKTEFNVMNKPDIYLTNLYGNYKELPPPEKRVNHSIIEVNFDTTKKE